MLKVQLLEHKKDDAKRNEKRSAFVSTISSVKKCYHLAFDTILKNVKDVYFFSAQKKASVMAKYS